MLDVKVIARFQIINLWDGLHTISAIENSGVEDEKIKTWIAWAKRIGLIRSLPEKMNI